VPATRIRAMTPSSRVEAVALRTGKINKNRHSVFKRRKFATKWYTTLCI